MRAAGRSRTSPADLGIHSETLRKRVRQAEADQGLRPDLPTSEEREEIRAAAPGELRAAARERDLEVGVACFSPRSSTQTDRSEPLRRRAPWPLRGRADLQDLGRVGVRLLPASRGRRSARAVEDERLLDRIRELHAANYYAYGYRRMWMALRRAGEQVPRCQVQRLMRANGIVGAKRRGKPWRTTKPDPAGSASARSRPARLRRRRTERALGRRPLLPALLGGHRLLRLRPRRLQPDDRRLAARQPHAHRPRPRRAADGAAPTRAGRRRRADPPLRPRLAVHQHRLHPDAHRPPRARLGRIGRRRIRQRARRVVRRQLQDRADQRPRLADHAASSSSPSSSTSAGTTPPACTRASATSRPSSTSSGTPSKSATTLEGATV